MPAPACTVAVYIAGTLSLASLYSDNVGTPKSNPTTSAAATPFAGYFDFYVATGRYDIRLSGGGILIPYTWGDVCIGPIDALLPVFNRAALEAIAPPSDGTVILMECAVSAGDGGGGFFAYNASSSATADLGTIIRPSTLPTTGRWLRIIEDGVIMPNWFYGGGADWGPATQAAADYIQTTAASPPTGHQKAMGLDRVYTLDTGVVFKSQSATFTRFPFTIKGIGASREGSACGFKATSAMGTMLSFPSAVGTGANAYYNFYNFLVDGNSLADVGISGDRLAYTDVEGVTILNTLVDAFQTDFAEVVEFDSCRFIGNANGISLGSIGQTANDIKLLGCEISSNSGIGVNILGCAVFSSVGTTIQSNAQTGVYFRRVYGASFTGGRFESNGGTGIDMTAPAYGVKKADVWICGEEAAIGVLTLSEPSGNVAFRDVVFTNGSADAHVLTFNVAGVTEDNCRLDYTKWLMGLGDSNFGTQRYFRSRTPTAGTTPTTLTLPNIEYQSLDHDISAYRWSKDLHTHLYDQKVPVNYFSRTYGGWSVVEGVGGTVAAGALYYNGVQSGAIATAGGATGALGLVIDVTQNLELRGKWVWFGTWFNTLHSANYDCDLYLATTGGTARGGYRVNPTTGTIQQPTGWQYMSTCVYVDINATAITAGIAIKEVSGGATPAFSLYTAQPSLGIVGIPYTSLP